MKISTRLRNLEPSATLKTHALAKELIRSGVDIVDMTAGEPDFDPPQAAQDAITEGLKKRCFKYPPAGGVAELRAAVAARTNLAQPALAQSWKPENVVITNGGKQALFNAILSTVDPGDEVLIPSPYWVSFPEMVRIAGGIPVFTECKPEHGFKLEPGELKHLLLTPKPPRMLILNSPCNPTGAVYTQLELREIGKVIATHAPQDFWILSDEIYDRLVFEGETSCSFLKACPDLQDRCITVGGLSKTAAMTGWRVGWSVAPLELSRALENLQGQSTSGVNALAQNAAITALGIPDAEYRPRVETYRKRRDICVSILSKIPGVTLPRPDGAFYLFLGVQKYLRRDEDSARFAERLLKEAKVAVIAGSPFGWDSYVRLSFSIDTARAEEGCRRLAEYLTSQL